MIRCERVFTDNVIVHLENQNNKLKNIMREFNNRVTDIKSIIVLINEINHELEYIHIPREIHTAKAKRQSSYKFFKIMQVCTKKISKHSEGYRWS